MKHHARLSLIAALSILAGSACAQTGVVEVWPAGKMPGTGAGQPEAEVPRNDGFRRITNVSRPTLELFPATQKNGSPAPAMIICPGGGYQYVVGDKEGSAIADWKQVKLVNGDINMGAPSILAFVLNLNQLS